MGQHTKKGAGGLRTGAGRKPAPDAKKRKPYAVSLLESEKTELVNKFGTLTKAIKSILTT